LGQSILVVCVQVSTLLLTPVVRPAISWFATPSEETPFSYWSIQPWFHIEGNLSLCSSYLPLGVPNGVLLCAHQDFFLAPLPGRKITSARGVSHSQSFYFVIVFAFLFYFILFASFIKNPKKIVSIIAFCFAFTCLL